MGQKGFAGIVLIVAVATLIGVGGYFAWGKQKTDPVVLETPQGINRINTSNSAEPTTEVGTSSWKTYTNTEYGFQFKYPAYLVADETKGSSDFEKRFTNVRVDKAENIQKMKDSEQGPGSEGVPYLLEIGGHEPDYKVSDICEGARSTLVLNGISATKCVDEAMDGPSLYIRLTKDGIIYYGLGSLAYFGNNIELIDQIVSTFKFIDAQPRVAQPKKTTVIPPKTGTIEEIQELLETQEWVMVIVGLQGNEFTKPEFLDQNRKKAEVKNIQDAVLPTLNLANFKNIEMFDYIVFFAAIINKAGFEELLRNPYVTSIALNRAVPPAN